MIKFNLLNIMNNKIAIGYTTGVFDLFHIGHVNILKNARSMCDYLIVGVTTDEIALKMKNKLPLIPFKERIQIIKSNKYVDKAVPKTSTDITEAWHKYKFDIVIKGDDWKGTQKGQDLEKELDILGVPLLYMPYTKNTSSTIIREAILQGRLFQNMSRKNNKVKQVNNTDTSFDEKFKLKELTIKTSGNWIISLRPQQPTLGSLILSLNRKCESLAQITEDEGRELQIAFREVENILGTTFKPDKINYLALMMIDKQVHFHVIPRFSSKVIFEGNEYLDHQWPGPPSLKAIDLDSNQFANLLNFLRN